jgi:hypothetical protein
MPLGNDCYLRIAVAVVSALNVHFLVNAAQNCADWALTFLFTWVATSSNARGGRVIF